MQPSSPPKPPALVYASRTEQILALSQAVVKVTITGTNGRIHIRYGKAHIADVKTLIRADSVAKLTETSEKLERNGNELSFKQIDAFRAPSTSPSSSTSYFPPIIDLTISIPREAELRVESFNSDIKVDGIAGPAFLKSYNGRIDYEAQIGHPENIFAKTRNGNLKSDVLISTQPDAPVHLETYNGDVTISATAPPKHLLNGKFFDGRRFVSRDWYVVDGLLTRRAPSVPAEPVDLKGDFVAPAYGDAHTHHFEGDYFSRLMMSKYLPQGTLFAQTMTEHVSMKAAANTVVNQPDSMDVAYADAGFTATNGHPTFTYESLATRLPDSLTPQQRSDRLKSQHTQEGDAYWIVDTPEQLNQAWPKFLASDPDLVKVFLVNTEHRDQNKNGFMGSIGLDPAILPLIVQRAHHAGLRVYAHIDTALDYKIALENGVDGLAHMPGYGFNEGSPDTVKLTPQLAKLASGHCIQLTAGLTAGYAGKNLSRSQALQAENIKALRQVGAIPVVGSDSYGSTTQSEVEAWFQLGQTPLQVLTALSKSTPQSIFPWRSVGEIAEGYEADLVVLYKNPLRDRQTILHAAQVLKRGKTVFIAKEESK
jgi:imidazolonepropionase-like amidohydrolase